MKGKIAILVSLLCILVVTLSACEFDIEEVLEESSGSSSVSLAEQSSAASSKKANTSKKQTDKSSSSKKAETDAVSQYLASRYSASIHLVTEPKDVSKEFVGKWSGSFDVVPALKQQGFDVTGSSYAKETIEFTSKGTMLVTVDKASYKQAMKYVCEQLVNNEMTDNNMTKEEYEAQLGMTVEQYIEEIISDMNVNLNYVYSYKVFYERPSVADKGAYYLYIAEQGSDDYEKNRIEFENDSDDYYDKITLGGTTYRRVV